MWRVCLAVLILWTGGVFGQTGQQVLERTAKKYASLKSLRVKSTIKVTVKMMGMETTMTQQHEAIYARPNLMKARWTGMGFMGDTAIVCDGKELFMEMGLLRQTQRMPAPSSLAEISHLTALGHGEPQTFNELTLFAGVPWKSSLGNAKVTLLGRRRLGQRLTYVVQIRFPDGKVQTLWIGVRDNFIWQNQTEMRQKLPEFKPEEGEFKIPSPKDGMHMVITETFTEVVANPPVSAKMFTYALPQGYKFVKEFEVPGLKGKSELEGKPAPDFELPDLQGKIVRLSDQRGKVVVLNFFSHWCGPCNSEAPDLEKLWQSVKEKGVVIFGIAVWAEGDAKKRALEFARKHKLSFPVLVDAEDKVAKQFGIEGVPTTFVVGRDGKIQTVIVGAQTEAVKEAIMKALK